MEATVTVKKKPKQKVIETLTAFKKGKIDLATAVKAIMTATNRDEQRKAVRPDEYAMVKVEFPHMEGENSVQRTWEIVSRSGAIRRCYHLAKKRIKGAKQTDLVVVTLKVLGKINAPEEKTLYEEAKKV